MATRSDLRDEFDMADDVFALSPISASPVLPGEADYEAIRDAFMETSRGRWFLGEYAKRNRNSDTSMVLDAVSRIEHALSAQRQQQMEDTALPDALAKIRAAVKDAAQAATAAVDELAIAQRLTPVRIGTRIIKEISWRWREIGADSRICDLIDSQIKAIDTACDHLADIDPQPALAAAFDIVTAQLDDLSGADAAKSPSAATDDGATLRAEVPQPVEAAPLSDAPEPVKATASTDAMDAPEPMIDEPAAPTAEVTSAQADIAADATEAVADALDEAVLERVAMEMASDDFEDDDTDEASRAINRDDASPVAADEHTNNIAKPDAAERMPEPELAAPLVASTPSFSPPLAPEPEPTMAVSPPPLPRQDPVMPEPPAAAPTLQIVPKLPDEPSLGSTLLANGLVLRPRVAANDPLTPIRRMTQPEKIAFFS